MLRAKLFSMLREIAKQRNTVAAATLGAFLRKIALIRESGPALQSKEGTPAFTKAIRGGRFCAGCLMNLSILEEELVPDNTHMRGIKLLAAKMVFPVCNLEIGPGPRILVLQTHSYWQK